MSSPQRLSENAFRRLVKNLSAEQLREFPPELLPESIPVNAIAEGDDPRKQDVLDELAWQRGASELRMGIEATELLGQEARTALEVAESASSHGVGWLKELVDTDDAPRGGATSAAEEAAQSLAELVGSLYRALSTLDETADLPEEFAQRIQRARRRTGEVLQAIEPALRRYYDVRIASAQEEMQVKKQQCQDEARHVREVDEQIQFLREELDSQAGMRQRLFQGKAAREQRAQLEAKLQELTERRDAAESFVSEDDLVRWLDILVDASLFMEAQAWRGRAQRARMLLFSLLNNYCLQQEAAARQVAATQRTKARAQSAANHFLASEEFVLRYFSRKRHSVTAWLSGAASDKLAQFDEIRDAIVTGYRRHARTGGG